MLTIITAIYVMLGMLVISTLVDGQERRDVLAAYAGVLLWPWALLVTFVVRPVLARRREKARQARISAKVESGAYSSEYARETLAWKGDDR